MLLSISKLVWMKGLRYDYIGLVIEEYVYLLIDIFGKEVQCWGVKIICDFG